jgi:hypothetical protein
MRKLLAFIIVAALGWSAYWFIGSQGHKAAMTKWMDDRRAEGWQVEYSEHNLRGFPSRFDTTFVDLQLTDPETGISWQAPFFQIMSLSYQPNHLIAVWPNTQTIATPREKFTVKTADMRASFKVKPSTELALDNATIEITQAEIASSAGWTSSFEAMTAAIREVSAGPHIYDVAANIDALLPADPIRRVIERGGDLPDRIETLRFDLQATLDAPLNRVALETQRPDVTNLLLRDLRGTWGKLELRAQGDMEVRNAQPQGEVNVTARNWRDMIGLAVETGALDPGFASTVELGLGMLASASGGQDSLDATLSFSGGRTFIGPIPIGPSPEIRIP